ncbi:MAG: glycosyltransferase family 39 protein [Candidatus Glassbacteria bacterium]
MPADCAPGQAEAGGAVPARKNFVLTTVFFLAASLLFVGRPPLFDPDEGYYPAAAVEMAERGNWFDPVFNGQPRWEKPFAFYFAECFSFRLAGRSEFAARLPSLVAGLGLALTTLCIASLLFGPRAGALAGTFAATALQPVVYSRAAVPDMFLALFVTLSLYGFLRGRAALDESGPASGRWLLFSYAAAGLAFLSKGPLGVILPAIAAGGYLAVSGDWRRLARLKLFSGTLLFLAVAAPWYVYMYAVHGGSFLDEHFLQRNVERYFTDRWQHPGPLYYYLPVLLAGAFPWTILVAAGVVSAVRKIFSGADLRQGAFPRPLTLVLSWLLGMLLFFSFSRSKLPNYVLPLYPAVLALAGWYAQRLAEEGRRSAGALVVWSTAGLAGLLIAVGAGLLSRKLAVPAATALFWLSPVGLVPIAAVYYQMRGNLRLWSYFCGASMAVFFCVVSGIAIGRIDRLQAVKSLSAASAEAIGPGGKIAVWRVWKPSFLFYSGRKIVRYDPERDPWGEQWEAGVRWILTRSGDLAEIRARTGRDIASVREQGGLVLLRLEETEPLGGKSVY